ncbi:MAG: hypothetical protein HQL64_07450 [Magnetococcales bacterium]|nr:hypothetical protein [Magnetococcales bacterium]
MSGRRQEKKSDLLRRWFQGDECDLFVWEDEAQKLATFQLAWNHQGQERLLLWKRGAGFFSLGEVDDGEMAPERNRSPILVSDGGESPQGEVLEKLRSSVMTLPEGMRQEILAALNDFQTSR